MQSFRRYENKRFFWCWLWGKEVRTTSWQTSIFELRNEMKPLYHVAQANWRMSVSRRLALQFKIVSRKVFRASRGWHGGPRRKILSNLTSCVRFAEHEEASIRWFRSLGDPIRPFGSCVDSRVYEALGDAGKMLAVKEVTVSASLLLRYVCIQSLRILCPADVRQHG